MNYAEVKLWGTLVGVVALAEGEQYASFQYDSPFLQSGIQVSPLKMPLSDVIYRFSELDKSAFHGLPGLLADTLPDRFGNAVFNAWLASIGKKKEDLTIIERLCYLANRGMGALEFIPALEYRAPIVEVLQVESLLQVVKEVLSNKENNILRPSDGLVSLMEVGTSAGGMRAKASLLYNDELKTFRSGQVNALPGETYWIIKFGGVDLRNTDALVAANYSQIEYAYYLMARASGIRMNESRLYEFGGTYHFMTKRFDRIIDKDGKTEKLHMQTLGALTHTSYNEPLLFSYEEAAQVMNKLGIGHNQIKEFYRRMIFNVITTNLDDHVKNTSFLMDRQGRWSLSPAYDLTLSFNPESKWTSQHQMFINGKAKDIMLDDVLKTAKAMSIKKPQAIKIINEVVYAVNKWSKWAKEALLTPAESAAIFKLFNKNFLVD